MGGPSVDGDHSGEADPRQGPDGRPSVAAGPGLAGGSQAGVQGAGAAGRWRWRGSWLEAPCRGDGGSKPDNPAVQGPRLLPGERQGEPQVLLGLRAWVLATQPLSSPGPCPIHPRLLGKGHPWLLRVTVLRAPPQPFLRRREVGRPGDPPAPGALAGLSVGEGFSASGEGGEPWEGGKERGGSCTDQSLLKAGGWPLILRVSPSSRGFSPMRGGGGCQGRGWAEGTSQVFWFLQLRPGDGLVCTPLTWAGRAAGFCPGSRSASLGAAGRGG